MPRRFAFRHPLVRRAVYQGAKAGWRLAAHRAAADALARRGAPAAERAHHVEHAARRGDLEAVAVLREAAEAIAHRTPGAAARWFRGALRLLPEGPAHDEQRQGPARGARLGTTRQRRPRGMPRGAARRARPRAARTTPPDDARLEAACATVEAWLGRADDARRRLLRARAAVRRRALAGGRHARHPPGAGRPQRARLRPRGRAGRGALATARELDEPRSSRKPRRRCRSRTDSPGTSSRAREHHDEALAALEGLSDAALAERIEIFFYLAWAENYIEEPELAIATAERGLAISRATGQGHLLVPLMLARALPCEVLGRLAESVTRPRRRSPPRAPRRTPSTCSGRCGSAPTRT